MHTKPGII